MTLLSVIIPTWDSAGTIERALASVLDDHRTPLECVVVDDGSSDGTADVVDRVAERDPRVVLHRLDRNAGVSNARNVALTLVRGEWLTFLDADDRLLPGAVAMLMAPTRDPAVRAVVGQRIWWNGERTWISRFYDIPDIREAGRKSIATHPGLVYYASVTGKVFHRSLADDLRFEGRVLGDQPWAIRAMLRAGDGIEVLAETVYEWARSPRTQFVPTITNTTRGSAERLAGAVVLAGAAFQQVGAEIDLRISNPATRETVRRVYAERLVRSDFSVSLIKAIDRHDPATGFLLERLGELITSFPPAAVRHSDAILRSLLRPPWRRWSDLDPAARHGYWRMVDAVRAIDPAVEAAIVGSRWLVPGFRLARFLTGRSRGLSSGVARTVRAVGAVPRVARRIVRRR